MSTRALLVLAVVLSGALTAQIGVVPAVFLDAFGAPVLPVAVLAAWGAARRADAAWIASVPVALALASVSELRAGWFLLALAPTPLLAAWVRESLPAPPAAAMGAALGTLAYVGTLALAANRLPLLSAEVTSATQGALLTALSSFALAAVLTTLRPRPSGLFTS